MLDAYRRVGGRRLADAACVCGVRPLWRLSATVDLPHWEGLYDDLHVYERIESNR